MNSFLENRWISYVAYMLDEAFGSNYYVLKQLEKEFGGIIYRSELDYQTNTRDLYKMFRILNSTMFDGQLKKLPIHCYTSQQIIDDMIRRDPLNMQNILLNRDRICSAYASHIVEPEPIYMSDKKTIRDIRYYDEAILVNIDKVVKSNFILPVAILCHEMIHYFQRMYTYDYFVYAKKSLEHAEQLNTHKFESFRRFMKLANDQKIYVTETDQSFDWEKYNETALSLMNTAIVIDESEDSIEQKCGDLVFDKKNGRFLLCHFD